MLITNVVTRWTPYSYKFGYGHTPLIEMNIPTAHVAGNRYKNHRSETVPCPWHMAIRRSLRSRLSFVRRVSFARFPRPSCRTFERPAGAAEISAVLYVKCRRPPEKFEVIERHGQLMGHKDQRYPHKSRILPITHLSSWAAKAGVLPHTSVVLANGPEWCVSMMVHTTKW